MKLSKDRSSTQRYSEGINSYIGKGYAKKIRDNTVFEHRNMMNQQKPDKMGVVPEASTKFKGTSLKDFLLIGPGKMNNFASTTIKFRLG